MQPREAIRTALSRAPGGARDPKLVAFLTAGYPNRAEFLDVLRRVASAADAVEIGVPVSDPMADGVTIQRASHSASRLQKRPTFLAWCNHWQRLAQTPGGHACIVYRRRHAEHGRGQEP